MAFDLGSVVAHIKADISDFKAGIEQAKNEANNFRSHLGSLNTGLKQLGVIGLAAGAAFTAFGIKAGFSAARIEELGFALNAIAKANGIAQTSVDKTVTSLRGFNIAHEKALQITSLFIQSELDLADATKLATVAKDLAVVAGVDSSEAVKTLTEAIVTQYPRLLRQFGIVKTVDQIFEEYGKTIGKTSDEMTQAEKKQATLNVILEEGKKVVGTYDAAMGSVSKRYRSLTGRIIPDFIAQVGLAFQPAMVVIIDTINAKIKEMSEWLTANKDIVAEWGKKIGEAALLAVNLFGFFVTFLSKHKEIVLAAFIAMGVGLAALVVAFVAAHAAMIGIVAGITVVIVALKTAWDSNLLGMRDQLTFVWNAIRFIFNTARDFINGWGKDIFDYLTRPFRDAWNTISDLVNKIKNALDFTKRRSPSVLDIVNRGVDQVNSALARLNISDITSPVPITSMGGIGSVIVNLDGAYIGDMATATRLAEKIGDGIIKKLNRNIRF